MHGSSLCMCFWRKTGSGRLEVAASDVSGRWNLLNQSQLKAGAISPGTPALPPPSLSLSLSLPTYSVLRQHFKWMLDVTRDENIMIFFNIMILNWTWV